MKRIWFSIAVALLVGFWLPARGGQASAPRADTVKALSATSTKTCHTVTKRVHGKRKKVKVCKSAPATPSIPSTPGPADPLTVTTTLDSAHAATQTMTASQGGTLTATGADGSQYILTIPAGALVEDTAITMTPIASMGNLPPGATFAAGVDLQPEGLTFAKVAQLEVRPAKPVPLASQTGTEYYGAGTDFHLEPLMLDTSKIVFPLYHFSGRAMMDWRPARYEYIYKHPPSAVYDAYAQIMAADVALFRSGKLSEQDFLTKGVAVIKQLLETVGIQDAQAGLSDDTALSRAIADYTWAARMLETYNLTDQVADQLKAMLDLIFKGIDNSFDRAAQRCNTTQVRLLMYDPQVGWTIDRGDLVGLLATARQAILIGVPDTDPHLVYAVASCRPRGFAFGPITFTWDGGPNPNFPQPTPCTSDCNGGCPPQSGCHGYTISDHEEWTVKGRLCGEDPHGPWQVTMHNVGQERFQDGYVHSTVDNNAVDVTSYWSLEDNNVFQYPTGPTSDIHVTSETASFLAGPPPQVTIHVMTASGVGESWLELPYDQARTSTVTEDMGCPAPPAP